MPKGHKGQIGQIFPIIALTRARVTIKRNWCPLVPLVSLSLVIAWQGSLQDQPAIDALPHCFDAGEACAL